MNKSEQILQWYKHENPGVRANLRRILDHGALGGKGKLVILPVDQGFEHGPIRSFGPNPPGFNPLYHVELAIDAGCKAYAAPLGFIEMAGSEYPGVIPLILKINNNDVLFKSKDPIPAVTASIENALELGCAAVGFTVYPGSAMRKQNFEELTVIAREAKKHGLAVVVWSYPRGSNLTKDGETGVDIACYAAQIAAQMGADIIKVKPPTGHIELEDNRKIIESENIPITSLAERVALVVKSAFDGKRITIFSGGEAKETSLILEEIQQIHKGGGFGSIVGRNAFQRPKAEAIKLLRSIQGIYASP